MGDHIILKTDTDVTLMANGIQKGTKDLIKDVADLKKGLDKLNGKEVTLTVKGKVDMSEVEAAKKEAAKPIETPVKLKLDTSEIKALQNLPTAKAKVEFLIDKKAVNDIVAKDLNNVINKAATKMNSKLQGITSKSMASLASLDKFLPNIPELSSSKHRAMMTELKKKGLSDISQNERAQIENAYRLRSYLLDSKKEMSKGGKFIPSSGNLTAPDTSLSLEDYNKALNGLIKTSKNIIIASDLFEQLNKQLKTNKRNIPVEQDVSSKTMRRLLGMGIKKNDPDYDSNNYAQYLLNQSLNKAGFSDDIDKIVAHQTHKIELSVTNSHLDTIFKKSQNEGLSKKDYSELVNRYINKSLAELEKDILSDDQFGEIALGSISDIKKKAETLNDSLKTRRKNKFIGLMSTYIAKGGSGINNEEFYKALLSDISEYDKDIDAEGKQKAIEQAVQKQLTEQKAAENKEEKSALKKTTRKRTAKKKESIPVQTDVEEEDASASTPAPAIESKSKSAKSKAKKVSKTTTSKSAKSKEKETQELLDQLGSLEGELMRAYDEYVDKKEAYKNGKSPFQYANARENYRTTYIKMLAAQLPASSFKNITGKDPFSILKAKSLYDHAYNTSRQIFGIKDSLHDLGYTRDAYPEMFDSLDGMARKIITVNNMRYNNRNKSNGDTDEIVQIIKDVENQATQLEDMVRADGHSGFTLKGIPSIQEPSKENISKPKSKPTPENEEERQIQQSKDVTKAKKKEADAVVAANDKIAKSEKKVAVIAASPSTPPTPPKYKVVSAPKLAPIKNNDVIDETKNTADAINQSADAVIEAKKKESDAVVNSNDKIAKSEEKVAIKTVSGLKNSNSNLTETPVTPPELDGLKQLSQREFGDAQKYIKVYEDTNRTIYTLTQTYKKQFDANGNLLAEGYENAIAYYDSYEKLEGEAVKLSKKINSNYAKLDTERYKPTNKQNPNYLKKLQDDIKSDQQDLSELHRIARLNASLPDNDYMYQNFTQALRKGSAESARSLSATRKTNRDNFNEKKDTLNTDISKQISDIESLGQAGTIAAGKLQGIQKSLSTITTPAGLENVQKQITDINEQFDSNKARESALNYVHNLEQGLTGKQNVVIGTKNVSDNFADSINKVNGTWTGPLANLDKTFKFNRNTTATEIDGYIADAKKLGDIGKASAEAFSNLKTNLESCYTESGLKQIQTQMRGISKEMSTAKKQADEAAKNSETAKINDQYTQIMSDMSNLEKKNKELRTALKSDKNSDYIKNITAERDAYTLLVTAPMQIQSNCLVQSQFVIDTTTGSIPYQNMKWTPYEVNSSGNPIYLDYDNREYFSYNGYGHNHTLLPNTEGGCAIGIGNVDKQDADVTATWCIMPYNIYTEKKTDENINGIPVITSIKRDASATMNIGSKNNKFNCLYVNAIHMGGQTYTSLNSGGGKITSYKATASQVNYNADPKVETSVNTAGDTLTFKFSIPKGKDGTNGKDGKNGARGPQGEPGPQGPQGEPGSSLSSGNYEVGMVTTAPRSFSPLRSTFHLGHAGNYRWEDVYAKNTTIQTSDEHLKDNIKYLDEQPDLEILYMNLKPISYKLKNFDTEDHHDRIQIGFGARETETIMNNLGFDINDYSFLCKDKLDKPNKAGDLEEYSFRYGHIISLNTHMIQKAHHRIDDLEKSLTTALSTIETLKQEIETLKQAIA